MCSLNLTCQSFQRIIRSHYRLNRRTAWVESLKLISSMDPKTTPLTTAYLNVILQTLGKCKTNPVHQETEAWRWLSTSLISTPVIPWDGGTVTSSFHCAPSRWSDVLHTYYVNRSSVNDEVSNRVLCMSSHFWVSLFDVSRRLRSPVMFREVMRVFENNKNMMMMNVAEEEGSVEFGLNVAIAIAKALPPSRRWAVVSPYIQRFDSSFPRTTQDFSCDGRWVACLSFFSTLRLGMSSGRYQMWCQVAVYVCNMNGEYSMGYLTLPKVRDMPGHETVLCALRVGLVRSASRTMDVMPLPASLGTLCDVMGNVLTAGFARDDDGKGHDIPLTFRLHKVAYKQVRLKDLALPEIAYRKVIVNGTMATKNTMIQNGCVLLV
eukprot:PhF_6_TR10445/c0_g1_i8/m.16543